MPVRQQGIGERGGAADAERCFRRGAGGCPLDAARDGIDRAGGHGPHHLRQHRLDDRVAARADRLRRTPVEAGPDDELDRGLRSDPGGELAGEACFRDIGAVVRIGGIIEVVLHEAPFRAALRGLDDLRQNELTGHGVTDRRRQRSILESVRERAMEQDDVAGEIQCVEVHRAMPPGSVRIPEGDLGPRHIDQSAGLQDVDHVIARLRDEGLQGLPVHYFRGRHRRVAVIDVLIVNGNQVRLIEIESREQNERSAETGRGSDGRVARGPGDARYIERAAVPGPGCSEGCLGRSGVGQVGRVDAQRLKDRSVNPALEQPARERHGLRVLVDPAVGRQGHEIGAAGTPGAPLLPQQACDMECLFRGLCSCAKPISHSQRELPETSASGFHLLRGHVRRRDGSHASGKRARVPRLRQSGVRAGKDAGQHEKSDTESLGYRGRRFGLHPEDSPCSEP